MIPTATYADTYGTEEEQGSKPILNGEDETVQVKADTPGHALFFNGASAAAITLDFRPNEAGLGLNR